jgi:uncharacterized membrane protein YoaK (UPF0700 family)
MLCCYCMGSAFTVQRVTSTVHPEPPSSSTMTPTSSLNSNVPPVGEGEAPNSNAEGGLGLGLPERTVPPPPPPPPYQQPIEANEFSDDDESESQQVIEVSDLAAVDRLAARRTRFVSLLAFSAGFLDVFSQQHYGCFVNMCTGNTIRGVMAFAEAQWTEAFFYAALVVSYCFGVGFSCWSDLQLKKLRKRQASDEGSVLPSWMTGTLNRGRKTPPRIPHPCRVAALPVVFLFACSDWISALTGQNKLHAAAQSAAYGLIHTTASHSTGGTVLFAMTGHWASLSRLSVERNPFLRSNHALRTVHVRVLASFLSGILLSVQISRHVRPVVQSLLRAVGISRFPIHTCVGLLYAGLLLWYGSFWG